MASDPMEPAADAATTSRRHAGHEATHAEAAEEMTRRLKSIEGHVRGIQKMVREDAYCIDLLKQIKAVRAALDRVGTIALETHLRTCVTDGLQSETASERDRMIREILEVFDANGRR